MNEIAAQYESAVKYAANHDAIGQPIGFTFSLHHPDRGRMTFEPHTPRGVVADALEESGRDQEASTLRSSGRVYNDNKKIVSEKYPHHSELGGYPLYYLMSDAGVLCPQCVNENQSLDDADDPQWHVHGSDVHWEGPPLTCDHCNKDIPSAYGDPDEE